MALPVARTSLIRRSMSRLSCCDGYSVLNVLSRLIIVAISRRCSGVTGSLR